MTANVPTTVLKKDLPFQRASGTTRRMVEIYVEADPTDGHTTNLATYIPGLTAISGLELNGTTTAVTATIAAMPDWSGTTVTWRATAAQYAMFIGYY